MTDSAAVNPKTRYRFLDSSESPAGSSNRLHLIPRQTLGKCNCDLNQHGCKCSVCSLWLVLRRTTLLRVNVLIEILSFQRLQYAPITDACLWLDLILLLRHSDFCRASRIPDHIDRRWRKTHNGPSSESIASDASGVYADFQNADWHHCLAIRETQACMFM